MKLSQYESADSVHRHYFAPIVLAQGISLGAVRSKRTVNKSGSIGGGVLRDCNLTGKSWPSAIVTNCALMLKWRSSNTK
uniref:Transposase n=1 Tax=Ascaris lumbricoides TaxID=6252 RepID=A0A0M3HMX2_ASCLU